MAAQQQSASSMLACQSCWVSYDPHGTVYDKLQAGEYVSVHFHLAAGRVSGSDSRANSKQCRFTYDALDIAVSALPASRWLINGETRHV
jgi:hypothetical protein